MLTLLGMARDLIVNSTIHRVHLFVFPLFILGQTIVAYIAFRNVPFWLRIAHAVLRQLSAPASWEVKTRHSQEWLCHLNIDTSQASLKA